MRIWKVTLTVLVVCLALATGYLVYGAQAHVSVQVETAAAQEHTATYDSVVAAVQSGAAERVLSAEAFTGAADYTLVSMRVTVQNPGLLPMEWLTCEYLPAPGDVAVYEVTELPADVAPGGEKSFFVRLIRKNGGTESGGLRLTYYVAGQAIPKEIR